METFARPGRPVPDGEVTAAPLPAQPSVEETAQRHGPEVARPGVHDPQEQYRQIVEAHTDPICRFVPDGTLTFVNDAYCAYFDKSEAEALGDTFFHLMSAAQRLDILTQLSTITPDAPIFDYEHKITLAPGEFRWIKWTVRGLFDERGAMLEV